MTATLKLNLGEALSLDEFRTLTDACVKQGKSMERLLFEVAKDYVRRESAQRGAAAGTSKLVAAGVGLAEPGGAH